MKNVTILIGVIAAGLLAFDSYFFLAKHQPLKKDLQEVIQQNAELQREVQTVQKELNQKVAELSTTVEAKKTEIKSVQSTKDSLISEMQQEIQRNQIQITQMADKLKLSIVDKILFPSGEADISPEGLKVLQRVGNILKNTQGKVIRVEGHTDNVPIGGNLKSLFPTNWELSMARANNMVRFLHEKVGIDPKRMEAVGLGEYHPVAANSTKEGRAQNRRIEILLLPM